MFIMSKNSTISLGSYLDFYAGRIIILKQERVSKISVTRRKKFSIASDQLSDRRLISVGYPTVLALKG
jgi:hypothetical protein